MGSLYRRNKPRRTAASARSPFTRTPAFERFYVPSPNCARADIVDLHFHDLRHEAGSPPLLDAGWPIHHVKEMLGHANLSQTHVFERRSDGSAGFDAAV
jgi:integrase